jgi:hypothetical protein
MGATYWSISSSSVSAAGYVTAAHEDLEFPTIAATDSGTALMSFTLSGQDYYPSSAYTWLTSGPNVIHITAVGKSPEDGFSGYQGFPGATRPRWGDYGAAIYVPSTGQDGRSGGNIYFATEYIQYPNCNDQAFINGASSTGVTCGGTRTLFANWGSSINYVSVNPFGYGLYGH